MITAGSDLHGALRLDFELACIDLAEARCRGAETDPLARRDAVVDARARIDAILDMHLDASAPDQNGRDPVDDGEVAAMLLEL
jgi:hypothetical protein